MELKAGARVGPYELLSALGAGGMGEVWKARDTRLERTVAIKFSREGFNERFQREARAVAALNHPNIATLHDVGDDYLVMEFVDGEPVRAPGDVRKLLDIAVQIADGLAAAHGAGIVHRDLKPDNILLSKSGRVKILDFGLAKRNAAPGPDEATIKATLRGTVMGTVGYMSPEQARGEELGIHSDQFSFGQVLYELAAGKRAFDRPSAAETMAAIIRDEAPPLPASQPQALRWVVERLLAKQPEDRYDTTRGLYLELRALRDRWRDTSVESVAAVASPVRRQGRLAWMAGGAALASLLLLLWQLRTPWQPDTSSYRIVPFANEEYPEESPSWSPDGRSLAYVRQTPQTFEVVVRDLDGSPPVVVAKSGLPVQSIHWSPDGTRIYFNPYGAIFTVGRAGGEPFRLKQFNRVYSSAISPDGRSLAALETGPPEAPGKRRLVIASPPDSTPKVVPGFDPDCCFAPDHLAWSPDSKRLLASLPTARGQEVWLVNPSGGARRLVDSLGRSYLDVAWLADSRHGLVSAGDDPGLRILDTETGRLSWLLPSSTATQPSVSRDGSRIAYVEGARRHSILEMPLDGSPPRPLLRSRITLQYPSWAPKTNQFLYVRGEEVVVHNRDTGVERTLVSRNAFPNEQGMIEFVGPAFSPDESRVVFTLRTPRGEGVWVMPLSGGTPIPIGETGGNHASASWSPDGKWIVYTLQPQRVRKIRLGGNEPPVDLGEHPCRAEWSPVDDWILCTFNPPTRPPYLFSGDGKKTIDLPRGLVRPATWSRDGSKLYMELLDQLGKSDVQQIMEVDWKTGATKPVVQLPKTLRFSSRAGGGQRLSLSPDGKSLAGTVAASEGDIWILEGLEPPRSLWERLRPWK